MFDLITWWQSLKTRQLDASLRGLTRRAAERKLRASGMSIKQAKRYLSENNGRLGLVRPE
jgi:hypothetical protein